MSKPAKKKFPVFKKPLAAKAKRGKISLKATKMKPNNSRISYRHESNGNIFDLSGWFSTGTATQKTERPARYTPGEKKKKDIAEILGVILLIIQIIAGIAGVVVTVLTILDKLKERKRNRRFDSDFMDEIDDSDFSLDDSGLDDMLGDEYSVIPINSSEEDDD